jgi:hypothetical protein
MPNTPALIGAGVTGLYADPSVDAAGRAAAERILAAVGSTVWADAEAQMDAVTAISGSGPAYVFHFIEALEAAGAASASTRPGRAGWRSTPCSARRSWRRQSEDSPAVLRQKVTSKGGTTEAALASLAAPAGTTTLVAAVRPPRRAGASSANNSAGLNHARQHPAAGHRTAGGFLTLMLLARFYMQWQRISFRNQLGQFVVSTTDWIVRRCAASSPACSASTWRACCRPGWCRCCWWPSSSACAARPRRATPAERCWP